MLISVALMTQLHLLYKNLKIKKKINNKRTEPPDLRLLHLCDSRMHQ